MNERLEAFFELPIHYRAGAVAGVFALVAGFYYYLFYGPVGEELAMLNEQIQRMEQEITEKRGIARHLPKFEREIERLDVELKKAVRELPDKKSIDKLLARISDKARDAGLEIHLFQPLPEQLKDFYAEIPVELKVTGTYHEVATFFDEVGHLKRIVNIGRFAMEQPSVSEEEVALTTSAVATSFRFLEESERPSNDKRKGKRRRRT